MKKIFLYTTALLTSFACSNAYAEKCQKVTKDEGSLEYCYDENDNLIAVTYYGKDGNIPDYSKYAYLPDSVHASSVEFPSTIGELNTPSFSYINGRLPVHTEYVYDASGYLTNQYSYDYNSDSSSFSIANLDKYTYDDKGNITSFKSYIYDENNLAHIDLEEIYKYDGNGTLSVVDSYSYDASYDFPDYKRYSYAYDNGGKIKEQYIYDYDHLRSSLELSSMYTYDYNENGNITNFRSYEYNSENNGVSVLGENYSYDTSGNLISQQVYSGDLENGEKLKNEYVYAYDTNGNLAEQFNYSYNPESLTLNLDNVYTYEYDSDKNLISLVKYDGDPEKSGKIISLYNYSYSGYYDIDVATSSSYNYQYIDNQYTYDSHIDFSSLGDISFDPSKYQNLEYIPKNDDITVKPQRTHYTTEEAMEHVVPGKNNTITFTFN